MIRDRNNTGLSDLEREFELEMEEEPEEEKEIEEELEAELERDEPEEEYEEVEEESANDYAERFYELSQREYESEAAMDDAVNGILNEMERDYFFGKLKKSWKRLKKKGLGRLLQKGLKLAAGQIPALQALKGVTQLARGDMKGLLGSLAKAGLSSAIPGSGAALTALGFEATEEPEANRDAWNSYAEVAREAYEHLAENLNERADEPLEASRLATDSLRSALKKAQTSVSAAGISRAGLGRRTRVIRLKPGQRIIIEGA